ncbi:MAG TPA: PAC2 family protein [Planctomycetaceae bacterium]|nr:PAC2 family protein [Planctomycetaceae bacterium]
MHEELKLHSPWLLAVWPGMGSVAISAGYYLMAKLGMHVLADFAPGELFDVDHIEVRHGLIIAGRPPRSRLFLWRDPHQKHDLIVLIGEAQPPLGKQAFCTRLIQFAEELGVERVFTFAAMATQMHPEHNSHVFGAATDEAGVDELRGQRLEILEDGHIGGLNGVLLGVAAERGLRGACLLGEIPHIFAQVPFPRASLAVLKVFQRMLGVELDLEELTEQVREMDEKLGELLGNAEPSFASSFSEEDEPLVEAERERITPDERQHLEDLFDLASRDRSKAYELKQELDRLQIFAEYEDRFLDLFKKS